MYTSEVRAAVEDAEQTLRVADNCVKDMAKVIAGRLRNGFKGCTYYEASFLIALKKELSEFDCRKRTWK